MKSLMLILELMTLSIAAEPTPAPKYLYPAFENRVCDLPSGYTLKMSVGLDSPGAIRCDDAKRFGIADGLYSCWSAGGVAKMQRIEVSVPSVGTPAYDPKTRYYAPVWQREPYCPPGQK